MNPTLSARLLTRRSDGFFRAHPPAPWDAVLETPVALQALALVQPVAAPDPSADLGVWEPQVMEKVLPFQQQLTPGVTVAAAALESAAAALESQTAEAPTASAVTEEQGPAELAPAPTQDPGAAPELLVLALMAVVWLVDGWLALRQGLRRRPTSAATTAAECKASGVSGTPRLPYQAGMAPAGSPPAAPRSRRPPPVLVA